jgi:hypothetical protein
MVRNTRSDNRDTRSSLRVEPTSDSAFLLVISTLGFGMLTLLAVLVLAGDWGLVGVLPLFVFPLVLLVGSAGILLRWVLAEAKEAAAREEPTRCPFRSPRLAHSKSPDERLRESRRALEPGRMGSLLERDGFVSR